MQVQLPVSLRSVGRNHSTSFSLLMRLSGRRKLMGSSRSRSCLVQYQIRVRPDEWAVLQLYFKKCSKSGHLMRAGSSSNTWICLMVSSPQSSQRSGTIEKKEKASESSHVKSLERTHLLRTPNLFQEPPCLVMFSSLSIIIAWNRNLWQAEMIFPPSSIIFSLPLG